MKQNLLAALLLAALFAPAQGAALEETGRRLVKDLSDAVVTVQIVVQQGISFGGQERTVQEQKSETTGTIIGPDGLTVVSLTTVDPSAMVDRLMRSGRDGMSSDFDFDVNLTDARLLMPDGREVPATMVLRDRDLDLAFLRPIAPQANPFVYVDLTASRDVELLDAVFVVSRMGRVGARQPAISMDRVHAQIKRPRPFYVLSQTMAAANKLGAPVFGEDGAPVGVLVLRSVATPGSGGMSGMFGGLEAMGMLPIVQPAVDILETAEQVPPAPEPDPDPDPAGAEEEHAEHEHAEHEHVDDEYAEEEHAEEEQGDEE